MAEAEEPKSPPTTKKSMFPLLLIVGVVVFAGLAVGVMLFLQDGDTAEQAAILDHPDSGAGEVESAFRFPEDEKPLEVATNLMGGRVFISASFLLEMNVEASPTDKKEKARLAEVAEELEGKVPKIQEAIIVVLNGTNRELLESPVGRENVKSKMMVEINKFLKHGQVQGIIINKQITQPME